MYATSLFPIVQPCLSFTLEITHRNEISDPDDTSISIWFGIITLSWKSPTHNERQEGMLRRIDSILSLTA